MPHPLLSPNLCSRGYLYPLLTSRFFSNLLYDSKRFLSFRFLGNEPFQRSVPVRVVDLSCLQVDFYKWQEHRSDKEMLCSLFVIPTSQAQVPYI